MNAVAIDHLRRGWCPGTLTPMETGDGLLVRLHPPGGRVSPAQLALIAELSDSLGNGLIDVTARANLQLRGLSPKTHRSLVERLLAADLVDEREVSGPSRLTMTGPLAGVDPTDHVDAAALGDAVETACRAIAGLPAKIAVTVDGGGGFALGPGADITIRAIHAATVLIGLPHGLWLGPCLRDDAPSRVASILVAFAGLAKRTGPDAPRRLRDLGRDGLIALAMPLGLGVADAPAPRASFETVGQFETILGDQAVLVGLPFGQIEAATLAATAGLAHEAGVAFVRPTPWRGLAFVNVPRALSLTLRQGMAELALIDDARDPRLSVFACAGAPACGNGFVPARRDAARISEALAGEIARGLVVHVSGCAKGCAHPSAAGLTLTGSEAGYGAVLSGTPRDAALPIGSIEAVTIELAEGGQLRSAVARQLMAHSPGTPS